MSRLRLLASTAVALGLAAAAAPGAARATAYSFTELGSLGGRNTYPNAINASGQVTGFSNISGTEPQPYQAFRWSAGTLTAIGGDGSVGYAINAGGDVAGSTAISTVHSHAALWPSGGMMSDLGTLGTATTTGSIAYAINAAGAVAGTNYANSGTTAFYRNNGLMIGLGTLGGLDSYGYGINAAGLVTGNSNLAGNADSHAFVSDGVTMTDLGGLFDHRSSGGLAINDAGQVAGFAFDQGYNQRAVRWSNGVIQDLGSFGNGTSSANAIDSAGRVVGFSTTADLVQHAFLWNGSVMTDLNSYLPTNTSWTLTDAVGINDAGQIVATAVIGGAFRAVLLTPLSDPAVAVPTPGALSLFGAGLLGLGLVRRRRG